MPKIRTKIPPDLVHSVLYKSAKTCCVCRTPRAPVEVHHIDQNPANNVEDNLIAICRNCHDEAHTRRSLSQNLTPARLIDFKHRWQDGVASRAAHAMLPSSNLSQAMWTYVNHQRLPDVMNSKGVRFDPSLLPEQADAGFRAGAGDLTLAENHFLLANLASRCKLHAP